MSNEVKDYIAVAKAEDLKNPKDKLLYRFLEIFPGFLSWGTLISVLLLSWLAPIAVAIFIILFSFYWLLKISYLCFHQVSSFNKLKKNLKINWLKKLKQFDNWREIYHLIILPMYKEEQKIVEASCQSLIETNYPKDRVMVVLATEQRAGEKAQKIAYKLQRKFSNQFLKFLVTIHPQDIPGEVWGKGSNTAWALKEAQKHLVEPLNLNKDNILVSTFDIDTKPYEQYFSCLTVNFLTAKNARRASYQPIPVYNNNIWSAPAFSRVVATSGTFWQMMQQERADILVTYSSHSVPLRVLEEVGYPHNVISDDSRIFWKSYLYYNGDYRVVPLHYPVSMDAVLAHNLPRTIINQYRQQKRWAWGCNDIPFVLLGFLKNKKIPWAKKLNHSLNILDGFWSWATASFLIFFLGWLPLALGGEKFNVTLLSYNLPRTTRNIMTVSMVGMVISCVISLLLLPPRPKKHGFFSNLAMISQWILLPFVLIIFGGIPALDAQTRLSLGSYLEFWVTEKTRI